MNAFREAFREVAELASSHLRVWATLLLGEECDELTIPPQTTMGIEVLVKAYDYGVYLKAGSWDPGCFDVAVFTPEDLRASLSEILRSLAEDAVERVYFLNGQAVYWEMHVQCGGERIRDAHGSREKATRAGVSVKENSNRAAA